MLQSYHYGSIYRAQGEQGGFRTSLDCSVQPAALPPAQEPQGQAKVHSPEPDCPSLLTTQMPTQPTVSKASSSSGSALSSRQGRVWAAKQPQPAYQLCLAKVLRTGMTGPAGVRGDGVGVCGHLVTEEKDWGQILSPAAAKFSPTALLCPTRSSRRWMPPFISSSPLWF